MSDGLRLLSSVIATGSAGTLMRIDPEMMVEGREREAYDFVRGHHRTYRELPQATTLREETGIVLPGAPESLQFYVDQVNDRYTYNSVRDHFSDLRTQMQDRDVQAMSSTIDQMQRATRRAARNRGHVANIGEALVMTQQRLQATVGMGGMTGITAGLPRFDAITGGFQASDLISIIGRPSLGKTYELLHMAVKAFRAGHSVLFVTTEMGLEQIARRYVALELGIDPTALKMNTLDTYLMRRISALVTEMMDIEGFKIFSVGMRAKVGAVEALMQEFGPSIVYIDGAYLLHPSVATKYNRIERVGEVFDELKGLTIDSGTPIVNTMQFNRVAGKDGKEGSLENIGFSDAVGMHSSLVLALKFGPTANPRHSRTLEFLKGREGEVGGVSKHFKFAPLHFDEFTEEEEANATSSGDIQEPATDIGWMATGHSRTTSRRHTDPAPDDAPATTE